MTSIHGGHSDTILDVARASRPPLVDPRYRFAIGPSRALVEALLQCLCDEAIFRPPNVVAEVVDTTLNLVLRAVRSCVDCAVGARARQACFLSYGKLDCLLGDFYGRVLGFRRCCWRCRRCVGY